MTQPRKPRIGRKRWGPLIRYLTETMQNARSERMRMQAALRLSDVLTLREQREQLELRRELRMLTKVGEDPEETPEPVQVQESAEEAASRFLASMQQKGSVAINE